MRKGFIGCEHSSKIYLEVAKEMRERRHQRVNNHIDNTIESTMNTKRGKRSN